MYVYVYVHVSLSVCDMEFLFFRCHYFSCFRSLIDFIEFEKTIQLKPVIYQSSVVSTLSVNVASKLHFTEFHIHHRKKIVLAFGEVKGNYLLVLYHVGVAPSVLHTL